MKATIKKRHTACKAAKKTVYSLHGLLIVCVCMLETRAHGNVICYHVYINSKNRCTIHSLHIFCQFFYLETRKSMHTFCVVRFSLYFICSKMADSHILSEL